jgi:hypothetical protein
LADYDLATKIINTDSSRQNPDRFIELFHSYLNPFESFELFWKYLDRESKLILVRLMALHRFHYEIMHVERKQRIRSYRLEDANLNDFVRLIKVATLDLSCINEDSNYKATLINKEANELKNLGFLKYFGPVKILNLRGQKNIVSSWGLNFNCNLKLINLSDIPKIKTELIIQQCEAADVTVVFENTEFIVAEEALKPSSLSYNSVVKYLNFVENKLENQDYPKILFPKCYFEKNKSFKEDLNPEYSLLNTGSPNTIGKSEKDFGKYLKGEFKNKILTNQTFVLHKKYNPLLPDFVYHSDKLFIDIEVDEPYVISTKIPSHYNEYDRARNYQFLKRDWFIIRFTEEQVVRYPTDCICFFKKFIESIEEGKLMELLEMKGALKIAEKSWEIEDCIQYAKSSYRNTYLNSLIK